MVIGSQIGKLSVNIADTSGMIGDVSGSMSRTGRGVSCAHPRHLDDRRSNKTVPKPSNGGDRRRQVHPGGPRHHDPERQRHPRQVRSPTSSRWPPTPPKSPACSNSVSGQIREIHSSSEAIQGIATQTQLLAVNAGHHGGACGRSGPRLCRRRRRRQAVGRQDRQPVSRDTGSRGCRRSAASSTSFRSRTPTTRPLPRPPISARPRSTRNCRNSPASARASAGMITEIERISAPVEETTRACTTVLAKVLRSRHPGPSQRPDADLGQHQDRPAGLVFGKNVIGEVAQSGIETEDTPLIRHCNRQRPAKSAPCSRTP